MIYKTFGLFYFNISSPYPKNLKRIKNRFIEIKNRDIFLIYNKKER